MHILIYKQATNSKYSGHQLSEIQEPHPQPTPRKRGGGYDLIHLSAYRYIKILIKLWLFIEIISKGYALPW